MASSFLFLEIITLFSMDIMIKSFVFISGNLFIVSSVCMPFVLVSLAVHFVLLVSLAEDSEKS